METNFQQRRSDGIKTRTKLIVQGLLIFICILVFFVICLLLLPIALPTGIVLLLITCCLLCAFSHPSNGLGDAIEHLDVFGPLCFEWLQNGFGDKIDGVNKASGLIGGTRETLEGLTKVPDHPIIVRCIIASNAKNLQAQATGE